MVSDDSFVDPNLLTKIEELVQRSVEGKIAAAEKARTPIAPERVSRCSDTLRAAACAALAIGAAYLAMQNQ